MLQDHAQREQALDPSKSFIVQAPAGSGKTELLVRRFLVLLAQAENPEDIVAITFTRKAASEMRHRIIRALMQEENDMIQKVLHNDKKQNWNLLQNPNRLRIQTIDAFCQRLTAQMPLLSQFGMQVQLIEDATLLYREAAREVLNTLEEDLPWSESLSNLLLHLENQQALLENLFIEMLKRRDQWLPYVISSKMRAENTSKLRDRLEEGLRHIVMEHLATCYSAFPPIHRDTLIRLMQFAAEQNPAITCLEEFPQPLLENYQQWLSIARFLLTQEFQWRRKIDKNIGFPQKSEMKAEMLSFLEKLNSHEMLRQALQNVVESPARCYTSQQWIIMEALLEILPVLAAQLKLVFAKQGTVDFSEISLAALNALGDDDAPSDLALHLDYKIRHILVDEFQDTSITQFKLLEKLTAHWQKEEGRTLFLVGDPMQSIYRFREAEVGLFLKAQSQGIGSIALISLCLQMNFRSSEPIVNWINEQFRFIFPQQADITSGAIPYTPCTPIHKNPHSAVEIHILQDDTHNETQKILSIIEKTRHHDANATIAILVRSRSHLAEIIPSLTQAKIAFSAVEIEAMSNKSCIQDLIALSRALLHLADRTAWLAVLRAPWCGLDLKDLHAIAHSNHALPIWQFLLHHEEIPELSEDAQQRLSRIVPVLAYSLMHRQRQTVRSWIEHTWLALGGPACLSNAEEMHYMDIFFDLLEKMDYENIIQPGFLEEKIQSLYISPKNMTDNRLQIMTIHKAKGLEFDTVIIPSMERKSPSDRNQLLMWLNRPREKGENDLILAPIQSASTESDTVYPYLRLVEKQKKQFETARLLYVAATRAKKNLHLIASPFPATDSFLSLLWPAIQSQFLDKEISQKFQDEKIETISTPRVLHRLVKSWRPPTSIALPPLREFQISNTKSNYEFCFNDNTSRIVGVLMHQALQNIIQEGLLLWNEAKIISRYSYWKNILLKNGILELELAAHLNFIHQALSNVMQDPKGQWILDNTHLESQTEFPISTVFNNEIKHFILDRTFVERSTNIRWIIDYKTSMISDKIAMDQYKTQLTQYAQAMRNIESREIRTGLYFPVSCEWYEVEAAHD